VEKQDGIVRWRGLNTTADRSVLEPGELVQCRNLLARSGALRKRPGLLRLASEETPRAWPPYEPPIDLPWVVQGDLWLRFVAVPVRAVVGDHWLLTLQAVNRSGRPVPGFNTSELVGLTVEGSADGVTWVGFSSLRLADGENSSESLDVTTGWEAGVWAALVEVTGTEDMTQLRLRLTYDGRRMDEELVGLDVLDSIRVELPEDGITPGALFYARLTALDAAGQELLWFTGSTVLAAWDDGADGPLTVTDAAGGAVVATEDWTNGQAVWGVILPARGSADVLRLTVAAGRDEYGQMVELGTDSVDIVEGFAMVWPASAQAFQDRVLEIRANGYDGDHLWSRREDFDGAGYSLRIEGSDDLGVTWEPWTGLADGGNGGGAPDVGSGWNEGLWSEVLRFEDAEGFSEVRISLVRGADVYGEGGTVAASVTGALHPVTAAGIDIPGQVAALSAFAVVIVVRDDLGYAVEGFDGSLFVLTATDEHENAIALTDGEGVALDFAQGWSGGAWQSELMFADAGEGAELRLSALFDGVVIGTASAVIGEEPPGVAHEFTIGLPPGVTAGVEFEVMLTALDAFGALAAEFDGTGLVLTWELIDAATSAVSAAVVSLAEGESLTDGWQGGVWTGSFTLESALGCEVLRVTPVLAGAVRETAAETPCALVFDLVAPVSVTTGNKYQLTLVAQQADGAMAAAFDVAELLLEQYRSVGATWVLEAHGLNVQVGWSGGCWEKEATAGAVGQVKWVLKYEGEWEADALVTIVADPGGGDPIDPPPEPPPPVLLTLSTPSMVWPGVPFTLSAAADSAEYAGVGAALTLTPSPTPAPAIGTGWSAGAWEYTGHLETPGVTGAMSVYLTWDPGEVPEDAVAEDFEIRREVPIGDLIPLVTLPAVVRPAQQFTLAVRMDGEGAGLLTGYLGDGYEGIVIEVSADAGATWVAAPTALTGMPTTGWASGVLRGGVTLGGAFGVANRIRVAGEVFGVTGAWAVAEVATVSELLTTTWTEHPEYLHLYGPAGTVRMAVTNAAGVPTAPAAGQLVLQMRGVSGGSGAWTIAPFSGLLDDATSAELSFSRGWTGAEWCVDALLADLEDAHTALLEVVQGWEQGRSLSIPLRADVGIEIGAPTMVAVGEPFALTLTARDAEGLLLVRYNGQNLTVVGASVEQPLAAVLDVVTDQPPNFATGWVNGVWTGQVYIGYECSDFGVTATATDTGTVLDMALIEVVSVDEMLLLDLRERQMAAGRTVWAVGSEHTLSQYRSEVNALAPSFISGTYSGGAATPTMQANTVGNAAQVMEDLIPVVRAMLVTRHNVGPVNNVQGSANDSNRPWAVMQAYCDATYYYQGGGNYYDVYVAYRYLRQSNEVSASSAQIVSNEWQYQASGISTGLAKVCRFFAKHAVLTGVETVWDNMRKPGIPTLPDVYELVVTQAGGSTSTELSSVVGDAHAMSAGTWPTVHALPLDSKRGFGAPSGYFLLCDWSFTHP
jgi:hypothetical protein